MNNKATILLLAGALAVTLLSACDAAFGADSEITAARPHATEPHPGEVLSVGALRGRLRGTNAISFVGKLNLKSEIDGLLDKFRVAHLSGGEVRSLRMPFDSLLSRIGMLLERDPQLAGDIASSREAIWAVLVDPAKFSNLG